MGVYTALLADMVWVAWCIPPSSGGGVNGSLDPGTNGIYISPVFKQKSAAAPLNLAAHSSSWWKKGKPTNAHNIGKWLGCNSCPPKKAKLHPSINVEPIEAQPLLKINGFFGGFFFHPFFVDVIFGAPDFTTGRVNQFSDPLPEMEMSEVLKQYG